MPDVKYIAPTRIGGTDIQYAQGVRAGSKAAFTHFGGARLSDYVTVRVCRVDPTRIRPIHR